MSEIDDGGPAFPVSPKKVEAGVVYITCDGLSKREWFAGMALQGFLSGGVTLPSDSKYKDDPFELCAKASFNFADSMLRAGRGEK